MKDNTALIEKLSVLFPRKEGTDNLISMTKSWNGYEREDAVRRLGDFGDPTALPALIIRVNDWVAQVRAAAKRAIINLLSYGSVEAFIECLPAFYHLRKCRRDQHDELIETIENYLLNKKVHKFVIEGVSNPNPLIQRACFKLVLKNLLLPNRDLAILGLKQSDVVTRCQASYLLRKLSCSERREALELALTDSFMPIRREALQIKIKQGMPNSELSLFLFDKHTSIREIAIKHLTHAGVDVWPFYLAELSNSTSVGKLRFSIWAAGNLKKCDELNRIKGYLSSDYPSVRRQVLICLMGLMGKASEAVLIEGLKDSSPAVCKESVRLLESLDAVFDAEGLFEVVTDSSYQHTVQSCVSLAKGMNKWEWIIFLLDLALLDSEKKLNIANMLDCAISEWEVKSNLSYIQPNSMQLDELRKRLPLIKSVFNDGGYNWLLWTLKPFGIYESMESSE